MNVILNNEFNYIMLRLHTKRLGYPNLFVCKGFDDSHYRRHEHRVPLSYGFWLSLLAPKAFYLLSPLVFLYDEFLIPRFLYCTIHSVLPLILRSDLISQNQTCLIRHFQSIFYVYLTITIFKRIS